jgi:hypothetical protein
MIEVPQSVLAYFQNRDVETAVDHLLATDKASKTKLAGVERWEHLPGYYRANLAARQTPVEFAILLEALWCAVWTGVPAAWRACPPAEPARPDLAVNVTTVWEQGCFDRRFEVDGMAIELAVALSTNEGIQLGVVLYDAEENTLLTDDALPGWSKSEDYDTYWTDGEIVPLAATIDPSPFQARVQGALSAVDRALKMR